jgi:tetratricopeptide (TPR) repeat protein
VAKRAKTDGSAFNPVADSLVRVVIAAAPRRALCPLARLARAPPAELEIQRRLGAALRALRGSPDAAVTQVYQRLHDIGRQTDQPQMMVPALRGLLQSYRVRRDLQRARDAAVQLLHLAHGQPDPRLVCEAHKNLGLLALHLGDLVSAPTHLEQGMHATALAEGSAMPVFRPGVDVGVSCRNFAALALWMLGYPAQALHCSQKALALARRLSHPQSLVAALNLAARLHQHRREIALAHQYTEASLTLSREHALTYWMILGHIRRGSLLAAQGQPTDGCRELRHGLEAYQARGSRVSLPIFLAQPAEVYGQLGQPAEGLRLLAEAYRIMHQGGGRSWEAEQYRLQGALLLLQHGNRPTGAGRCAERVALLAEAEECLRRALEVARQQHAKSWDLRAAMSLARLWQQQGRRQEAYDLLAPLYSWFTEGFDTADLQEAEGLLGALR